MLDSALELRSALTRFALPCPTSQRPQVPVLACCVKECDGIVIRITPPRAFAWHSCANRYASSRNFVGIREYIAPETSFLVRADSLTVLIRYGYLSLRIIRSY